MHFDVAVHHAATVGVPARARLADVVAGLAAGEVTLEDTSIKAATSYSMTRNTCRLVRIVGRDDVTVGQPSCGLTSWRKRSTASGLSQTHADLQGDQPFHGAMLGFVDLAHPAGTEQAEYAIYGMPHQVAGHFRLA